MSHALLADEGINSSPRTRFCECLRRQVRVRSPVVFNARVLHRPRDRQPLQEDGVSPRQQPCDQGRQCENDVVLGVCLRAFCAIRKNFSFLASQLF